ncbi:hypothetical protein G6L37_07105 [Agrobacterium rubi]|nr:hypothetical protein [Agrobacterium rubi]NTF25134.1 hypothetical protein [Agrobacterium rubi]
MTSETASTWNSALNAVAELARKRIVESTEDDEGNAVCRVNSNIEDLVDEILTLRRPVPATDIAPPPLAQDELNARNALSGLRDALQSGITANDEPHRVVLSDGTIVRGQVAVEWHAVMKAIIDLADGVLGRSTPWRAYPGASWPEEPVEADLVGCFATLDEAKAECDRHNNGGFDDFVIHETTREIWRRRYRGNWFRSQDKVAAS